MFVSLLVVGNILGKGGAPEGDFPSGPGDDHSSLAFRLSGAQSRMPNQRSANGGQGRANQNLACCDVVEAGCRLAGWLERRVGLSVPAAAG